MAETNSLNIVVPRKKRERTAGIEWSGEMLAILQLKFPFTFNRILAAELNVSIRTLIRKAREMGIEKEPGFNDKRRRDIVQLVAQSRGPNPTKGKKGWTVPGGEKFQFKKGNVSPMKNNPELVKRVQDKRNETIKRERLRIKYGLPQLTHLKIVNY